MPIADILALASLVERGILSVQKIQAMQADGVTDDEIRAEIERLKVLHDRHQSLDLRDPK